MKNHNKINVMVVDDSAVIRGMFANVFDSDPAIEVVATAANGRMAIDILERGDIEDVDVITLDIEMPEMDGLTALPEILKLAPKAKIVMVSSLSSHGAEETLKALSMGATDYMAKPDIGDERKILHEFTRNLVEKVKVLGGNGLPHSDPSKVQGDKKRDIGVLPYADAEAEIVLLPNNKIFTPLAIAIGSSTGGPQALSKYFSSLKGHNIKVPIFITQHMPAKFTTLLAEQISSISDIVCHEAEDGMQVEDGNIYLAAGDFHMIIKKNDDGSKYIHLSQNEKENFCRPAVDPMLDSLVSAYGGKLLVLIMTGMGSDGLSGAKRVVDSGGVIIAQDKESSVVWGMPKAVAEAGICSSVVPIGEMANETINLSRGCVV